MSWIVRFFGFLEEIRVSAPWKGVSIAQLNPYCLELCQPGRLERTRSSISTPGEMPVIVRLPNQFSASFHGGMVLKRRA